MGASYSQLNAAASASQVKPSSNTYRPDAISPIQIKEMRHVCIGINYSKTSNSLKGCIDDAAKMKDLIESRGSKLGLFMSDDHDPESPLYPCKENILRAMEWCMSSASLDDYLDPEVTEFPPMKSGTLAFITYSGHGSSVRDVSGDESDGRDEVICPVARSGNFDSYIVDDQIGDILKRRCKSDCHIVFVTDCCNSGTNSDLRFKIEGRAFRVANKNTPVFKGPVYHIAGCRDSQYSYEGTADGVYGGFLTLTFTNYLKSNSKVTLLTLITRLRALISKNVGAEYQQVQLSVGHLASPSSRFPL